MSEPIPPIGTQISQLARLAPDEPAVTCDGVTISRGELDSSTNRLARAYAERGVGVGDYVTMVLPNSIEWIQAAVACWKLGAVPQPLSARLPAGGMARHGQMHRTRSLDFAIVLSGEIWAIMDVGEKKMTADDMLVQRGTNHAWANRSDKPCNVAFILIDAKPLD